jgi:hypothetical protein
MVSGSKSVQDQVGEIQKLIFDASETLRQANWAMETLLARLDESTDGFVPAPPGIRAAGSATASPDREAAAASAPSAPDAGSADGEVVARRSRYRRWARGGQGPPGQSGG